MSKKVILFSLQTFSTTGGIQKMTRTLAHSIHQLAKRNTWDFNLWSLYDSAKDLMPQYLPTDKFKAFKLRRLSFITQAIFQAKKTDIIIISHINLAIIGILIKTINPKCKIWLIAHGIEVWRPLSKPKSIFLKRCDKIICVSNFTRQQMIERHNTDPEKCRVLNNAVDPFMKLPATFTKPADLQKRYNLKDDDKVIFTLTRLASTEQYKGHDQVIKVISYLRVKYPEIKYILAGQYDREEEIRIQKLIKNHHVQDQVILTGFIKETELVDHFLLADLFVLPSKKEGFGIVFIEALVCGLPVICGNVDGSVDAICNGELGRPINPDDLAALENAVADYLKSPLTQKKRMNLQKQCLLHFNESDYINNLEKLMNE